MATHNTLEHQRLKGEGDVSSPAPGQVMGSERKADRSIDMDMLYHCQNLYDGLRSFRERRARARRYHRGDQWGDFIQDPDNPGSSIREDEYIMSQGRVPLKQNVIRQLFKNLMGQFVNNPMATIVFARNREDATIGDMMGNAIRSVHDLNYMKKLEMAAFQEFAISGMVVGKHSYDIISDKNTEDIVIDIVNPNKIFFNTDTIDPRQNDIHTIGELHDVPIMEIISKFAQSEEDERWLRELYTMEYFADYMADMRGLTASHLDNTDFYIPVNPAHGRIIEVWTKAAEWRTYAHDYADGTYRIIPETLEEVELINAQRVLDAFEMGIPEEEVPLISAKRVYDHFWIVKYMTPYGHVLYEGETPYDHREHPYVITMYPGIDGEVWGVVEDIIDQQRYINRAFTLMDFIIGSSAKGVLLVAEETIPDDLTLDDFADEWTKVNGIIKYKAKGGAQIPQQIANNSVPIGLQEILAAQLKLSYDISGIHQAVQGQQAKSGTPASLYAQETQNATTNVKDFMEAFVFFREKMDTKTMLLIQQFYQERRWLIVKEPEYKGETKMYDPDLVRDVLLDLKVSQGPDTPVYRQLMEDVLIALFQAQAITVEQLLENSSLPFADKLLSSIRRERERMESQGRPSINPDLATEMAEAGRMAASGANPKAMDMINKAMG